MRLTRRRFLQGAGAMATAFLTPSLPRMARAVGSDPVLVAVYLRGGADGLNLVVPAGDPDYYALRPDIQVPPGDEIALDPFYGLHPNLAPLSPLYADGRLAFVHAAGSTDGTRSHFDAQDFMERAAPGNPLVSDGWLNRYLTSIAARDSWLGISFGRSQLLALTGSAPSLSMLSLEDFALSGTPLQRSTLEAMYAGALPNDLARAASEAFAALDLAGTVPQGTDIVYPPGPYGAALADAAALIRADIGVRVLAVDLGGWDHHEGQRVALVGQSTQLAAGLAAFAEDLGPDLDRTCTLVMTEFGRTAAQNGSLGTDHGHGSVMLALGGGLSGGRVLTKDGVWPGLARADLFEGRDLAVTTDFRDVFAEVLHRHMGVPLAGLAPILPGHAVGAADFPGLFV